MIKAENLLKDFGGYKAVDGVSFTVKPGELFCFLGPNGAGKTTTIKMLIGILKPTSGIAEIAGMNVWADPMLAKSYIGYVPDSPNLYDKLTAAEFLEFVADIYNVPKDRRKKKIEDLLALFELSDNAGELLQGFSHGMRQKICIAAALLHDPKVLFLDEPTVGLDPKSARRIKDILKELCDKGVTVFLTTHILEIAERMADRVGIIQKGKLIFVGTVPELREYAGGRQTTDKPGETQSLEDLFLELTGGSEYEDISRYLEG